MAGFSNETVYGNGIDLSGGFPVTNKLNVDGKIYIGATSGNPQANLITSSDSSVTITNGSGTISLTVSGGSTVGKTITGNTGGPISPVLGNWNTLGTGSITIAGSGNTLVTQLTGLTNHALLVGAGNDTMTKVGPSATSGQVLQSQGSSTDPAFSTATYPATTTINQILYSTSNNVVGALASTARSILTTNSTGVPTYVALTDGQIVIGSTAGSPAAASITSTGGTISVTGGSNTINLEVVTGGFAWTDVTVATQTIAVENGYITDRGGGVTYTLPSTAALGAEFIILGKAGLATITPNANQQLLMGSASGTVGVTGTAVATNAGDSVTFHCTTAGASTVWRAVSWVGNWTLN